MANTPFKSDFRKIGLKRTHALQTDDCKISCVVPSCLDELRTTTVSPAR
jgi:hypothetical protein